MGFGKDNKLSKLLSDIHFVSASENSHITFTIIAHMPTGDFLRIKISIVNKDIIPFSIDRYRCIA